MPKKYIKLLGSVFHDNCCDVITSKSHPSRFLFKTAIDSINKMD